MEKKYTEKDMDFAFDRGVSMIDKSNVIKRVDGIREYLDELCELSIIDDLVCETEISDIVERISDLVDDYHMFIRN